MTSARRQRKSRPGRIVLGLGAAVFLGSILLIPGPTGASTTTRVVADWRTGLAIDGIDPVAYFTDAAAEPGRPELEYRFADVIWRFRNEGNRAAFIAAPEVYMPRFGGYDPKGVARGVATPGNPKLWVRQANRVYLFHNEETQAQFAADPQSAIEAAEQRWPAVMKELVQ